MYGGDATDSNAILCVESDPPPEPIWGAFKQLLQVRPSLDAFRQLMSTMKADSVSKDVGEEPRDGQVCGGCCSLSH
eukprot:365354-Amphidinium_carterae.1